MNLETADRLQARLQQAQEGLAERPFPLFSHSEMLGDATRLAAFKRAIQQGVREDSVVVDIGTGTGILRSFRVGEARTSSFESTVEVAAAADAVHIYFEADLGFSETLSGSAFAPRHHWQKLFLTRGAGKTRLTTSFSNKTRNYTFRWESP
jgi:hypothetical protein